jgi:hypothetical protein
MPRSPIGIGMVVGAALGVVLGLLTGFAAPQGAELLGLVAAVFLAACGLILGAVGGAIYMLAMQLNTPGVAPTDGPEADYHDLPQPLPPADGASPGRARSRTPGDDRA